MEVLTAYVRNRAPWPPKQERRFAERPENDVQAALAVLALRNVSRDEHDLDLKCTDLRGALFGHDANLARWMLRNAHLEGAKLKPAKGLEKADLAGASYNLETEWPDGHDPEARGVHASPAGPASEDCSRSEKAHPYRRRHALGLESSTRPATALAEHGQGEVATSRPCRRSRTCGQ
jgi:hypothetical protein